MHKEIEDEAPGKQWILLMIFFYFPGASSSISLCMVAQPEYRKWAVQNRLYGSVKQAKNSAMIDVD